MANIFNELIDMTTNNEIIDMYFPPDEQGFNVENVRKALNFLMDKARADTAKRIFAEIKNADDKLVNPNYNNLKTIINTIKKKFKVD